MNDRLNFPDRVIHQNLLDSRTAAATDRHHGQLRQEVQAKAAGEAQTAHEQNLRRAANMEVGRALNVSTVV
jgi:hypothetical protein